MPTLQINSHVEKLNRYLPFSVAHDQIYDEYQDDENAIALATVAYDYIVDALSSGAKCIVLTGDAGHGKTHLCRKLIRDCLGFPSENAGMVLLHDCNGQKIITPHSEKCSLNGLRVHKDFSEIEINDAAAFLERHGCSLEAPLVICANEGRLRAIVSSEMAGKVCKDIQTLFTDSFETGLASTDGALHIINLNYQSVSSTQNDKSSLIKRCAKWIFDGRRWNTSCGSCSNEKFCPINRNRELLSCQPAVSDIRVSKIETLCSTVERLGDVITIREMLMLMSYLVTGGLTCKQVHMKCSKSHFGWQHEYTYYNLMFSRPPTIPDDRLIAGIPILEDLRKLDPGHIANRIIDDRLLNYGSVFEEGELDLLFALNVSGQKLIDAANGIDDVIGTPQSRSELLRESAAVRDIVSTLRRRSFFDESGDDLEMLSRLGFKYGDAFLGILKGRLTAQQKVRIKNLVVAGLHGIQGLRLSMTETTLYLVDPAFGNASSDAAIIACQIPTRDVHILTEKDAWAVEEGQYALTDSVDWIDRSVVVRIADGSRGFTDITLDLMAFECVARSASGLIHEDFYAHQMRKIRTHLGSIAETHGEQDGQISVFMDGKIMTVSIDMGVVQVSGRA